MVRKIQSDSIRFELTLAMTDGIARLLRTESVAVQRDRTFRSIDFVGLGCTPQLTANLDPRSSGCGLTCVKRRRSTDGESVTSNFRCVNGAVRN
jgi:hypothetical protein